MDKKSFLSIVAAAAVLAGAGCNKAGKLNEKSALPTPTGPVMLKLKWTPNERVVQDFDMMIKTELNIPGLPAPVHQDMTMGQKFALTVLQENPDGGHEVEMEYLSTRMGMVQAGRTNMDYDSEKKSEADAHNPIASAFDKIIGSKIRFFLDASNNVDHMEGVDEMMSRMSAGHNAAQVAPIKSMFNEGYLKQMMSSSRYLPPNPVAPGDTWPVQIEFPMDMFGTLVINYNFTLARWEMHGKRNCARMEFQGTVQTKSDGKPNQMGMVMSIPDGTTTGVSWFDPELGITIDSDINQDMTLVISYPKNPRAKPGTPVQMQTMTNQMSQVLNIKLDSVN
jgi:hypothetical protein